jgi:hypothetical protein
MSEKEVKEAQASFMGFAQDLGQLRFAVRSALGLSPQRPLEALRARSRAIAEGIQAPQQQQACQGQRVRLVDRLPRPLGILDGLLRPQQAEAPKEPQGGETTKNFTPQEIEELKKAEEEALRKIAEAREKAKRERVRSQRDFSPIL